MVLIFSFERVLSVEDDRPGRVFYFAGLFLKNVETHPGRALRPVFDLFAIYLVLRRRVMGRENEVDVSGHERGVSRSEELFRGLGLRFTGLDRLAAVSVSFSGRTRAVLTRGNRRHR